MRERLIAGDPAVFVYATEGGDVVLEQAGSGSVRIPHDKIHQLTVWMRRIAAEFDGLAIPAPSAPEPPGNHSYLK